MKKLKYLFFLSIFVFAFSACQKEDDIIIPQYDHSLILSRGSGATLILTNPVDGKDLYVSEPSPAVDDIKNLKAGYLCKNAVFVAKVYNNNDYIMSIFTSDAKTGANTKAITGDQLFVADINVSQIGPKIVFTGKPKDIPQYNSLYSINEDGSGLSHLSESLEPVTGLDGKGYELLNIASPSLSPDGSKIAVNAHVDNTYTIPNSIFYEGIMVMNNDGSNKKFLYWEQGKDKGMKSICWTQDGEFLLFVEVKPDDNFYIKVKALNISNGKVTDLTTSFEINGDQVNDISTSPNSNKIVFNQHLGGGSDLFIAEYEIIDEVLSIKGSPEKLTDRNSSGYSYYTPCWQAWDENL